jgi:hypothetical protein
MVRSRYVIALLQPIYDVYSVNIREYGGELDDKDKDPYKLPTALYLGDESPVTERGEEEDKELEKDEEEEDSKKVEDPPNR